MESPDAHVLQTCWVWFRLENSHHYQSVARERCLCRREKEFLTISTDSGAVHYVALPFMVHTKYIGIFDILWLGAGEKNGSSLRRATVGTVHKGGDWKWPSDNVFPPQFHR